MDAIERSRLPQSLGQGGKTICELQEDREAEFLRGVCEVVDDFLQFGAKGHYAGAKPGSAENSIGTRTALPHSTHEPS